MALERNAYKALESVVGPENISEDPAVLLGYAFTPFGYYTETGKLMPFGPEAVVLPGSTEEVQGLIKVCNRYKVKFHASSTGWGPWSMVGGEGMIAVDLRRMNRIIEIDEKNRFAVIEPLVIAAQLQAEAMKRGLDCHIIGAGASHSPLASCTSFNGMGMKGVTTSFNERNVFGVEWVLPSGEVLRMGAPGSGAGWFSGDGPGPSLRGIMRGYLGACGGLGIFTKLGYKLYPWPGPDRPEIIGKHPQIGMKMPENMKYYYPYWESWNKVNEAIYKITEAGVTYSLLRMPPDCIDWYLTNTNTEFYELFEKEALPVLRKHRMGLNILIAAHAGREFEYKKKVFEKIVADTKGKFLALTPEQEAVMLAGQIKCCYVPRVFRPTGDFASSYGLEESMSLMGKLTELGEKQHQKHIKSGMFVEHGAEGFWGWPYEQGRYLHWENAYAFDPIDINSRKANLDNLFESSDIVHIDGGWGTTILPNLMGPFAEKYGPRLGNAQEWMRKIKNVLDPENTADHTFYISPEPQK